MKYNHLQINKIGIAAVILIGAISLIFNIYDAYEEYVPGWMMNFKPDLWAMVIITIIYLFAINMMAMRITVNHYLVRWQFGIGVPYKKLPIDEIESVKIVRNKWWYGWGIRRVLSGSMLYNVYGLDAVEIQTTAGKKIRLGTDEPKKLHRVLETLINKQQDEASHG